MKLLTHERQWRGGETVVAFGMFDGVHEGHARLMRTANELAALHDLTSVVYTFSSHPMATFAPDRVPPQLETRSEKVRTIAQLGVDVAVLRPFDRAYAALSPEEFVRSFAEALHPRHVVIGFNYSFGCKGAGKAEDMIRLGKAFGFETHVVPEVQIDGLPVSSTRIRAAVGEGDMEEAEKLLGRPYALCGVVEHGKQLGRRLDFPTANLRWDRSKALPPKGVYAALAFVRGTWYMAAVNIGEHPTAPGGRMTVEANLIGYEGGEFYGCHMRLLLCRRLRAEKKFDSLEALREEVMRNRMQTVAYFQEKATEA
ncbi:MAG: bifunctional riboflavin kinase/FAD synthetase [Clostridiales bacterium]|nr:bifunctional riboflavin kinase/FAD synthetase [Clostridiales bacterium]MDY3764590.1 bifunctional riboflavin kinase/FAD synthetase [Candidatus Ventricola sp.]MDY3833000.1 bifunctional riboflavin kinase/FAD synthetase [Candidatus Ventricola sp.]MDY4856014.1 bifunctional riboflavin kinase/FAD synthetase [Candidatus Ventricola sp.]